MTRSTNMEHVEVLRDLSEVCRAAIKAGDWKVDGACDPDAVLRRADAAIASLSAPQPPAEAHCATCSCVPGMTPAVRFDTTPAEKEGAVRDHLIRMGWTPPDEAQGDGDAESKLAEAGVFAGHHGLRGLADADEFWEKQPYGTRLYYGDGGMDYLHRGVLQTAVEILDAAPQPPAEAQPVALDYVPVKRSDLLRWAEDFVRDNDPGDDTDVVTPFDDYLLQPFADEFSHDLRALAQQPASDGGFTAADMMDARQEGRKEAQQPAAVDGVKCPWDGGSPCVEPMPAGMVYPKKPAPRAGGYLDTSGVEWNAWDAGQMEAYARAAYSDGWEAGYRAALRAVREAPVAIMDTREFLSLCAPTEDDFPALYALQGQRVRIVKEGE